VLFTASSFFCSSVFILFTGDLNPFWFQRMLRTHKTALSNPLPLRTRSRRVTRNLNQNRRGAPSSGWQASTLPVFLQNGPQTLLAEESGFVPSAG
jgi:hypothetical protein